MDIETDHGITGMVEFRRTVMPEGFAEIDKIIDFEVIAERSQCWSR